MLAVVVVTALAVWSAGCHEELGLGESAAAERIEVSELTLLGVDAFDEDRITSLLETRESGWLPWSDEHFFNRETFQVDLERIEAFYADHGYPDAEVSSFDIDLQDQGRAVALTVTITEGEPVLLGTVHLEGFDVLPPEAHAELASEVGLGEGQPISTPATLQAREAAVNALQDHGYPTPEVTLTRREQAPRVVDLVLRADPGSKAWFGEIAIAGNSSVDDEVIRRQLLYRPGDPYSRRSLVRSQRQLTALQLFEFVNVETAGGGAAVEVPTRVTVTEGKPRRYLFAVGYGTEEKLTAEASVEHVNFLGGARTLGIHGKWSWLDRGVEGRFTQPYLFRPDLSLSLRARGWYVDEPGFRARSQGGRATVTYARGAFTSSASFIHEFESSRIADEALRDLSLRDELIALGLNPTTGVQDGLLSALALDTQHTTVANPLDPRSGHLLLLQIEQAGGPLPGTFNYVNTLGEVRYYVSFGDSMTVAQRVRYGSIDPFEEDSDVPFFKRYFLGGSTSLRGWGRYEVSPLSASGLPLGGHSIFEASTEARFPIAGDLSGVVFLDVGNVWTDAWDFRGGDLLYDAGPGLRYDTPIGPLRLDFAYQLNRLEGLRIEGEPQQRRWRVHFSIGQAF